MSVWGLATPQALAAGDVCPVPNLPALSIRAQLPKQALLGQIGFATEAATARTSR